MHNALLGFYWLKQHCQLTALAKLDAVSTVLLLYANATDGDAGHFICSRFFSSRSSMWTTKEVGHLQSC